MTTDELLTSLPTRIGRNRGNGCYFSDNKPGASIGWLQLINDGKDWEASYKGWNDKIVCLNPDASEPPFNNAIFYAETPNEALQMLYDWCVDNGFVNKQ